MNWMDKLERKWGRHAVANLSRYFVLAQVIGYVVQLTAPGLMSYMNFDMGSILHGQIWRIVTWIFTPTASLDVFGILFLFCVLMWGSSLESMLGTFRMNVFLWGSVILCDIVGAIVYVVTRILLGYGFSPYLSTYYILMSMLLALAMCMPEGEVRLYFVLPIRMKWMAFVYGLFIAWDIVSYLRVGLWVGVVPIVASLLNFVIFYFSTRDMNRYNPKEIHRRQQFKKAVAPSRTGSGPNGIAKHKCAICGRTEKDDPNLEFRFCSKCNGNYEYCQDHLFTHKHVQ